MNTKDEKYVTILSGQISRELKRAWRLKRVGGLTVPSPLFISEPGTGKTRAIIAGVKEIASEEGLPLAPVNVNPEPGQFGLWVSQFANTPEEVQTGIPFPHNHGGDEYSMIRAWSDNIPQSGPGIWFIDEPFHKEYSQRTITQWINEGRVEGKRIPDDVLIVLASNDTSHKAGVGKIWSHTQNRICSFWVKSEVEAAVSNFEVEVTPEVSVYLRWFPKLSTFDPKKYDGPFASARTWDFVNTHLAYGADPINDFPVFQGLLGRAEASEFRACFHAVSKLPDIDSLMSDPETNATWIEATWRNEPSVLTALSFVVLRRLQSERDVDLAARAIPVFAIPSLELATSFIAVAKQIDQKANDGKTILDSKQYADHMVKNQKVTFN